MVRVDPATGAVQARITTQYPWAVACGDRDVWITSDGVGVQRIDRSTNRIVATARVPYPTSPLLSEAAMPGRQRDERDGVQGRRAR